VLSRPASVVICTSLNAFSVWRFASTMTTVSRPVRAVAFTVMSYQQPKLTYCFTWIAVVIRRRKFESGYRGESDLSAALVYSLSVLISHCFG